MNLADHFTSAHKDATKEELEQKAGLLFSSDNASDAISLRSGGGGFKTFTLDDDCSFWNGSQAQEATGCKLMNDPYRRPTVVKDKEEGDMVNQMIKNKKTTNSRKAKGRDDDDPLRLSLSVLDQDFSNIGHTLGLDNSKGGGGGGVTTRMHESLPSKLAPSAFDTTDLMGPRISLNETATKEIQQQQQQLPTGKLAPCAFDTELMTPLINSGSGNGTAAAAAAAATTTTTEEAEGANTAATTTNKPTKPRSSGGGTGGKNRKPRRDRTDHQGHGHEKKRISKSPKRNSNNNRRKASNNKPHNVGGEGGGDQDPSNSNNSNNNNVAAKKAIEMLATDFQGAMKVLAHNQQQPSKQQPQQQETDPAYNRSMTADTAHNKKSNSSGPLKLRRSNTDTQIPPQTNKPSHNTRRKHHHQQQQDLSSSTGEQAAGFARSMTTTGPIKNRLNRSITDGTTRTTELQAAEPIPNFKNLKPKADRLSRSSTDTKIEHQKSKSKNNNNNNNKSSEPGAASLNRSMTETIAKTSRRTGQYGPKVLSTSITSNKSGSSGPSSSAAAGANARLAGNSSSSSNNNNKKLPNNNNNASTMMDGSSGSATSKTMDSSSSSNRGRIEKSMDNSSSKLGATSGRGRCRRSDHNQQMNLSSTATSRRRSPHRGSAGQAGLDSSRGQRGRSAPRPHNRRTRSLETATKNRTGKDVMEERRLARQERQARRRQEEEEEEERRKQEEEEEEEGKPRSRSTSRSRSVDKKAAGRNRNHGGMTRSRSFDLGDATSSGNNNDDLPPLTFMSGGEISNATWKNKGDNNNNNKKLEVAESDAEERKKRSAAKKVASKARRLTKAMWGNKIKEARHNKLE